MKFSILITAPPYVTEGAMTALQFAKAAISEKHSIETVFFYQNGVQNANTLINPPENESNIREAWQQVAVDHDILLQVCVAAGIRRGLIDEHEANNLSKHKSTTIISNVAEHFNVVGLGQFIMALSRSDRLVTFGA